MAFSKATAFELIQRAHANGRLGHAYLISGAVGSGKRQLVEDIAAMVCNNYSGMANHPDVHIAEPESKSRRIVTDQIRELEHGLQMRSTSGGRKLGVIFEADRLQPQASNAFLKTLEEPPANTLLLLVTTIPEALPETIISRCISIQLLGGETAPLSEAQQRLLEGVRDYFAGKSRDLVRIYGLVHLFTGLLQAAKNQLKTAYAAEFKKEEALYKKTTEGKYLESREEYYDALAESQYVRVRFDLVDTLIQWWGDVARQQQGFDVLDLPQFAQQTAQLAQSIAPEETLRRFDHLEALRENLGRNVQESLAVEVAFLHAFA